MRRPATAKPLRQPIYLGDVARVERLAAVRDAMGAASDSDAMRSLIDLAAYALGIPGSPLATVGELLTGLRQRPAAAALEARSDAVRQQEQEHPRRRRPEDRQPAPPPPPVYLLAGVPAGPVVEALRQLLATLAPASTPGPAAAQQEPAELAPLPCIEGDTPPRL